MTDLDTIDLLAALQWVISIVNTHLINPLISQLDSNKAKEFFVKKKVVRYFQEKINHLFNNNNNNKQMIVRTLIKTKDHKKHTSGREDRELTSNILNS